MTKGGARGGARLGAGGKPTWKHGKTKVIRVPEVLVDAVLAFARELDDNGTLEPVTGSNTLASIPAKKSLKPLSDIILPLASNDVTVSKILDLSGISVRQHEGCIAIHLEDLVRAGYSILPESLSRLANARLQKLFIDNQLNNGNITQTRQRNRVLHS